MAVREPFTMTASASKTSIIKVAPLGSETVRPPAPRMSTSSTSTKRQIRTSPSRSSLLNSSAAYLQEAYENWPSVGVVDRVVLSQGDTSMAQRKSSKLRNRSISGSIPTRDRDSDVPLTPRSTLKAISESCHSGNGHSHCHSRGPQRPTSFSTSRQDAASVVRKQTEQRESLLSFRSRSSSQRDEEGWDNLLSEHESVAQSIGGCSSLCSTDSTAPTVNGQTSPGSSPRTHVNKAAAPSLTVVRRHRACSSASAIVNVGCKKPVVVSSSAPIKHDSKSTIARELQPNGSARSSLKNREAESLCAVSNHTRETAPFVLFKPTLLAKQLPPIEDLQCLTDVEQFVSLAGFLSIIVVDAQCNIQERLNRLSYLKKEDRARKESKKRNEEQLKRLQRLIAELDAANSESNGQNPPKNWLSAHTLKFKRRTSKASVNEEWTQAARIRRRETLTASMEALDVNTVHHTSRLRSIEAERETLQTAFKEAQAQFGEIILLENALHEFQARLKQHPATNKDDITTASNRQKHAAMRCTQHERQYKVIIDCEDHISEAITTSNQLQMILDTLLQFIETRSPARANRNGSSGRAQLMNQREVKESRAMLEGFRDRWYAAWSCVEFNLRSLREKVFALLHAHDGDLQRPSTASEVPCCKMSQQQEEEELRADLRKKNSARSLSVSWGSTLPRSAAHRGGGVPRRAGSHSQLRFIPGTESHPPYDPERLSKLFRQSSHSPVATHTQVAGKRGAPLARTMSKDSALSVATFRTAPDAEGAENMSPVVDFGSPVQQTDAAKAKVPPLGSLATSESTTKRSVGLSPSEDTSTETEKRTFSADNRLLLESTRANLSANSSMSTLLSLVSPPSVLQINTDVALVRRHRGILTSLETSLTALRSDWDELILKWEIEGDKLGEELVMAMRETDQAKERYWSSVGSAVVGAFVTPTS